MADRLCCVCGKKLDEWDLLEGLRIHKKMGFGSQYDRSRVDIDMCTECTDRLINAIIERGAVNPVTDPDGGAELRKHA